MFDSWTTSNVAGRITRVIYPMETLVLEPIAASFPAEIPVVNEQFIQDVIATAKKKVTYLKEGVTGKQLTRLKIDANTASKDETKTISWCIKQVNTHAQEFLASFEAYDPKDIVPSKLLSFRTEKEEARGKFSVWLVMQLITRMYKA